MKNTLFILILSIQIYSCSSDKKSELGIEPRQIQNINNKDSTKIKELYGSGEIKKYEALKVGRNYSPTQKSFIYNAPLNSSSKKKSQVVKISKEDALTMGYGALAFSFEAPPEYSVNYFTKDGALVKLQLFNENQLISEMSFITKEFDKGYGLSEYKQHLLEFSNDKSNADTKATLVEKQYFGKNNLNTLLKFKNTNMVSLAMIIPSLDENIYLMCVLSKKSININKPFNHIEDEVFKTLTINSVPINEIISSYK